MRNVHKYSPGYVKAYKSGAAKSAQTNAAKKKTPKLPELKFLKKKEDDKQ